MTVSGVSYQNDELKCLPHPRLEALDVIKPNDGLAIADEHWILTMHCHFGRYIRARH